MSRNLLVVVWFLFACVVPTIAAELRLASVSMENAKTSAAVATGELVGVVSAGDGLPSERVLISLSGENGTRLVVSDNSGRFHFESLIPGRYLLRTHLTIGSRIRRVVEIRAESQAFESVILETGTDTASEVRFSGVGGRTSLSIGGRTGGDFTRVGDGGVVQPETRSPENELTEERERLAPHDHRAKAWRLRRARRSVLKDAGETPRPSSAAREADGDLDLNVENRLSAVNMGVGSLGEGQFTRLVGGRSVSGEVQLLTRSTLSEMSRLWSRRSLPGQVAYVSLTPRDDADLVVHGGFDIAAGGLSSWVVAGTYAGDPFADHNVQLAMSYSKQAQSQTRDLLPEIQTRPTDSGLATREAGTIAALDTWSVSPGVTVDYGTTFARYGYLKDGTLLSPRAAVTIAPFEHTRVRIQTEQRMTAPGAEQFLPPLDGVWLPPERTFTSLSRFDELQAERSRHFEVGLDQSIGSNIVVGVKQFRQDVTDQLITMFNSGLHVPMGTLPAAGGHYYLASVSGVKAEGWGFSFRRISDGRLQAEVDYKLVHTNWLPETLSEVSPRTVDVFPTGFSRFHDVTTIIETRIPETATRVVARCRFNTAFVRPHHNAVAAGVDARFDVRIMQALPFSPIEGSSWELLLAFRTLYYEPSSGGSLFDELLVVEPPRQFVGGLVVQF